MNFQIQIANMMIYIYTDFYYLYESKKLDHVTNGRLANLILIH